MTAQVTYSREGLPEPIVPLKPRKMQFPFGTHIPRRWYHNDPLMTHSVNGLNLLFPAGERYFIRSVRHFQDAARCDPQLWERVRGFIAQEVRHGIEHKRFFATLEAQGFEIESFLKVYEERFFPWLEQTHSPELLLAGTVALEHYTATLGELVLATALLEGADEDVSDLLRWHAAEEIEHKSVAFDVMQAAGISYQTRMAGLALATLGLFGWWAVAAGHLLRQEQHMAPEPGGPPPGRLGRPVRVVARASAMIRGALEANLMRTLIGSILDYARVDFHPDRRDNYQLAIDYLKTIDPTEAH